MHSILPESLLKKANPKVVVVGGGFGGLTLINQLANTAFDVTLVDKNNFHTFQPLLYQVATASLSADSIGYPFRRTIAKAKNLSFLMAEVTEINAEKNVLITADGEVEYDILVLATGSETNFFGNAQIAKLAMQLKSISQALDIRSVFLQDFERAVHLTKKSDSESVKKVLNFVIVGAGPTGVEVAGALAEIKKNILNQEYREIDAQMMKITLIDAGPRVLIAMSEKSSNRAKTYLEKLGVDILVNTQVTSFDGETIVLKNGNEIKTNTVIWSAGVKGNAVQGLGKEYYLPNGRNVVDEYNKITNQENIFAIGDMAAMALPDYPKGHPMMAQPAIQQGENLAHNLKRWQKGKPPKPFLYNDKGSMATIGRNKAVVEIGKIKLGGWMAWYIWMVIHVLFLIGFRNRLVVLFNWAVKYISYQNTIRLIVRPFNRNRL